jgi:hypothetical protein
MAAAEVAAWTILGEYGVKAVAQATADATR